MTESKSVALPLGYTPISTVLILYHNLPKLSSIFSANSIFFILRIEHAALRKLQDDLRSLFQLAVQRDFRMVQHSAVLYNGQPQTSSPDRLGMTLIHPIEPFKDTGLLSIRNPDACIPHRNRNSLFLRCHRNPHTQPARLYFTALSHRL